MTTSRLRVFAVDPDPDGRDGYVLLRWSGEYDGGHSLYALIDDFGFAGLAETVGRSPRACDHCPGPLVEARVDSGPGPMDSGAVAVGPLDGPLPHARMKRPKLHPLDEQWRTVLKLDLDGDGRFELQEARRCGHMVPSGCSDEVCDKVCSAVTRPGREPDPQQTLCVSFRPDVRACQPEPE